MKIAFITDLHLPTFGQKARGVDTYGNFEHILRGLPEDIEFLIIGGDLSFTAPDIEVNRYVKKRLDGLHIPYLIIPGNHDDVSQLKSVFDFPILIDAEIYYVKQSTKISFICMDSSSGSLSQTQLTWLREILKTNPDLNIISIHHPILDASVPYMDQHHKLKNREALQSVLFGFDRLFYIFSGHYHIEKTIVCNNIIQLITPSLFIQIDQVATDFQIDHYRPAFRIIEIEDKVVKSTVRYLPHLKSGF